MQLRSIQLHIVKLHQIKKIIFQQLMQDVDMGDYFVQFQYLVALSPLYPTEFILGMEIRDKVTDYVAEKIHGMRIKSKQYHNISVVRTNAQVLLPNYIREGTLSKMFFCFADPCFKKKHHKRRIIYLKLLKPQGQIYTCTDVEALNNWHADVLGSCSRIREFTQEEYDNDQCIPLMLNQTEESAKVNRKQGKKYKVCYVKIDQ